MFIVNHLGGILGLLSKWEKRHERFFREYRDKLNEIYSKMPWAGQAFLRKMQERLTPPSDTK